MTAVNRHVSQQTPMFGGVTLPCWLQILRAAPIAPEEWPIVLRTSALVLRNAPLTWYEGVRLRRAIAATRVERPPVFIIGCFRSGTTHLHNVLAQHDGFGFLNAVEAHGFPCAGAISTPDTFLHRRYARFRYKRPMDNLYLQSDLPQEEEYALAGHYPHAFAPAFVFAGRLAHYVEHGILPSEAPGGGARWKAAYDYVLRKASLIRGGKQLLLKNPPNTARIPWLLELYPDARFVYIHRSPFEVIPSMQHLFRSTWALCGTKIDEDALLEQVFRLHAKLTDGYMAQRDQIPAGNLVEVRYDDLVARPLAEVDRIFETLRIPTGPEQRARIAAYLEAQQGYEKNRFELDATRIEAIDDRCAAFMARWAYERPGAIAAPGA
jgi:hypothetical protein